MKTFSFIEAANQHREIEAAHQKRLIDIQYELRNAAGVVGGEAKNPEAEAGSKKRAGATKKEKSKKEEGAPVKDV